jgi:DNA-binding response OmpR family regulator
MVSALGDEADLKHGMDIGANDYLPKQKLSNDGLTKLIKKYLGEN